ncbi:MAG: RNA polymerase sigma factor [Spirochaetes bacterium]|nr:RNA polymerase sigma factor [Spirochaetota bacterium]
MFTSEEGLSEVQIRALYDAVFPILHRIAFRIAGTSEAAEDIVHDSFIRLVERKIPFATPDDAKYWLIRVVKNNALNVAKRKTREARAYERYFREARTSTESAESDAIRSETKKEVQGYLALLPEKLRSVLVLKEYGHLNYREIGTALGITEGNVKVRVFRAREALMELMKVDSPEGEPI